MDSKDGKDGYLVNVKSAYGDSGLGLSANGWPVDWSVLVTLSLALPVAGGEDIGRLPAAPGVPRGRPEEAGAGEH